MFFFIYMGFKGTLFLHIFSIYMLQNPDGSFSKLNLPFLINFPWFRPIVMLELT